MIRRLRIWCLRRRWRKQRDDKQLTGKFGEYLAADFLCEKGFRIVTRNWRSPRDRRDEIDLVCSDSGALVFVEVRTQREGALVPGVYTVNERKRAVVLRAAKVYLRSLRDKPHTFRFDMVEVTLMKNGEERVLHFENMTLFGKGFQI